MFGQLLLAWLLLALQQTRKLNKKNNWERVRWTQRGGLGWQGENDDGDKVRDGNRVTMTQKRSDVGRQQEGPHRAFQLGDKTKWPRQRESVPVRHFSSHASLLYTSSTKGIWRAWIITEFLRIHCFQKHVMQVQCLFINPLWVDCFCSVKKAWAGIMKAINLHTCQVIAE